MKDKKQLKIKAVIMSHNQPENVDRLYGELSPVFDDVEVFDSGSLPDKIPCNISRVFPNIYWTGLWNEVIKTCKEYDAVWVLGGDIDLQRTPKECRDAIETSLPFGLWSPVISGRSKPFMKPENYLGKPMGVWNIEGISMAISGVLLGQLNKLPEGSEFGYGQDLWLCRESRRLGMKNIIDGRVSVFHPSGTGYDDSEAVKQMNDAFTRLFGADYRRTDFHFSDFFEENIKEDIMEKKFTIVTVDNGWGVQDFISIVSKIQGVRAIVMRKGVQIPYSNPNVESIPYDQSLSVFLKEADVALFTKIGTANQEEYDMLLKSGIPMVANIKYTKDTINHQKNGFLYQDESWAVSWIEELRKHPEECARIKKLWMDNMEFAKSCEAEANQNVIQTVVPDSVKQIPRVSVITPTYKRDLKIISRCMDCMKMQIMTDWEQIVCSDGPVEPEVLKMVRKCGDERIRYRHSTGDKIEGDYGNTVRLKCLQHEAKGEYILFCDDDNLIMPNYMEKMISALDSNLDCGFAVCRIMHFGPLHESEGKAPKVIMGNPVELYHIDPLQILVRREAMLKIGWDVETGYLSDGVTLQKLGKQFKHVRVEDVLGVHL